MSPLAFPFAVALPLAAAWVLIGRSGLGLGGGAAALSLRAGLSIVFGLGMASVITYAWLALGGTLGSRYAIVESVGLLSLIGALARTRSTTNGNPLPMSALERSAILATAAGLALLIVAFVVDASAFPHGDWDAWAIWNQRARFLLRGGIDWRAGFSPELAWSHPGYPLLVPASVARIWAFTGETLLAPAVLAGLFTLAPVLVAFGAVSRSSGVVPGAVASLLLIATDAWRTWGTSQGADVPLAAITACTVAALMAPVGTIPGTTTLALAGSFLGLAAWTKDEGMVIATAFAVWVAIRSRRASPRALGLLAAGAALPLAARLHFQATVAPALAAVFTEGQTTASTLARICDLQRWKTILSLVPPNLPGFSSGLLFVAVAAPWLLGARLRAIPRSIAILPLLGIYSAYLVVYAATPLPLEWHVQESARRVLLQPWPALLIGLMSLAPGTDSDAGTELADAAVTEQG